MDGIDAALVRIGGPPEKPRVRLLSFLTEPYPEWFRLRLLQVAHGDDTTAEEISQLHAILGEAFGELALKVCKHAEILPRRLFVIGSHGQTIHHFGGPRSLFEPIPGVVRLAEEFKVMLDAKERKTQIGADATEKSAAAGLRRFRVLDRALRRAESGPDLWAALRPSTLQIGEPSLIAKRTGVPVVGDFRTGDMAAGGQGAPLVPMVDYLLLRDDREGRVALNIGGIANVTVIPPRSKPDDVFGFDTGPGNMVIDALVRHFTDGREAYDTSGRVAARGKVQELVLAETLAEPFFEREPPKSAGREQFGERFVKTHFLARRRMNFKDAVCTATELAARTIADALGRFVFPRVTIHRLIVSGGGAHNKFLMERLRELLPKLKADISDKYGLPVDAKEAIAFAILADRTMHGLAGNLPSVTGASRPVILGKLVMP